MTSEAAAGTAGTARELSRALVAKLRAAGALRSRRWINAFQAVPRHVLVPRIYVYRGRPGGYELLDSGRRREWLEQVYADEPLVTELDGEVWVSSSSQPSLMAMMLESLAVTGAERVLEIGTGSGYNAALLCDGLGSGQVASIDIDPALVGVARARLAGLGYTPDLAAADGAGGYPAAAPYDRVPRSWIVQAARGGLIMVSLYRELGGGALALLTAADGGASGRFLPFSGGFMPVRGERQVSGVDLLDACDEADGTRRPAAVSASVLDDDGFGMFAALRLPGCQRLGLLPADEASQTWLLGRDGSWAWQADPGGPVTQGGPARLWDRLEDAYRDWTALGGPPREEFGLTVTASGEHLLWHGTPDGPAWSL
jgi:protein-L-isoaspartate O-methyltransferase